MSMAIRNDFLKSGITRPYARIVISGRFKDTDEKNRKTKPSPFNNIRASLQSETRGFRPYLAKNPYGRRVAKKYLRKKVS
jgi:hypothetical protein